MTSVGWSTAAQAAASPTVAGVPKATALVSVKAHKLATLPVKAHKTVSFTVLGVAGVPKTGVAAVVLKLVASKPAASGSLTAYPAGAHRPSVLSTTFVKGRDASSTVVVTPGSKGRASVANLSAGGVKVVPTVIGYYRKATAVSAALTYFKAVTPKTAASTTVKAHGLLSVTAAGARGVPKSGATGVVLEVTALTPAKSGTFTLTPSGATRSKVKALSFVAGRSVTNLVTVAPGSKGKVILASTSTGAVKVRIDVVGYLIPLSPIGGRPGSVAVSPHAGGAVLTWTAAAHDAWAPVLRYEITVVSLAPAGPDRVVSTGTSVTSFDVTGLTAGGRYAFVVRAVTREGRSAPSLQTDPVTLSVPAAPTAVTATSSAAGSVKVTWTASANVGPAITGYTITGAHSGPVTVGPTVTSYTFTGLTVGQTFVATVTATNAIGSSAPSTPTAALLVPGGTGSNTSTAVSVDSAGVYHLSPATGDAASSADGSFVVFSHPSALAGTDANGATDVFLRHAGATTLVSALTGTTTAAPGESGDAQITRDGHWVVFDSTAALVPADTNSRSDVYLYDTTTTNLTLVSVDALGGPADKDSVEPAISDDGRYVAFLSNSTGLVAGETASGHEHMIFVRDLTTGVTTRVSRPVTGTGFLAADIAVGPSISGDGNLIGYTYTGGDAVAGDSNGVADAFVYNQAAGTTTRVSTSSTGAQSNGGSGAPELSGNGLFAVFQSDASNLVAGDTNGTTDVFEKNLTTGAVTRVSVGNDGSQANGASTEPSVSTDGNRVLFTSAASNLVTGDTNGQPDAFLHLLSTGETIRVSLGSGAAQLPSGATASALSGDGTVALFTSVDPIVGASTATDGNAVADLFRRALA